MVFVNTFKLQHITWFTDQETVKLEPFNFLKKTYSINEQNKTKQSEVKEHYGRMKDNVCIYKLIVLDDICML